MAGRLSWVGAAVGAIVLGLAAVAVGVTLEWAIVVAIATFIALAIVFQEFHSRAERRRIADQ
jgi:hypothetical protein